MAQNTDKNLQTQIIYAVYVRNHTEEGTFKAVEGDLARIKKLGTDIIWLMPIHPIGQLKKKGSLGCPYSIKDYRDVNPFYGTKEDFIHLVDAIHENGMKCIIDVVYNHTSPDSILTKEHPEFFYQDKDGNMGNKVGDWADVVDLDYNNKDLWDYQIETLCLWAKYVDGFRCDVASFVPVEFWIKARAAVEEVRPGAIWLAETVFGEFGQQVRNMGLYSSKDTDAYQAFDIEYDYDTRGVFEKAVTGKMPLSAWMEAMNLQEILYPMNYNKMRCLENHDTKRFAEFVSDEAGIINYTALLYMLKGTTQIYAGQEFVNDKTPSLFEFDTINRSTGKDISGFLSRLASIKHEHLSADDAIKCRADDSNQIVTVARGNSARKIVGIFSLNGKSAEVEARVPDGPYTNLIDGQGVMVFGGKLSTKGWPIIIESKKED